VPFDQESMKVIGEPSALAEGMRLGSSGSADLAISSTGTLVYGTGASTDERLVAVENWFEELKAKSPK